MDSGSLVGHWTPHTYAGWKPRSIPHTLFSGDRFGDTLTRVEALKSVCRPSYETLAEAAMRYVLSEQAIRAVIPGMTSRAEVDMNVVYSDGDTFPEALKTQLEPHRWVRNYYWEKTVLSALWPDRVELGELASLAEMPPADDDWDDSRHDPSHPLWGVIGPDPRRFDFAAGAGAVQAIADWLGSVAAGPV